MIMSDAQVARNAKSARDDWDKQNQLRNTLEARGVKIKIDGCGCCGSPMARIEVDGVELIGDGDGGTADGANFDMFTPLHPKPPTPEQVLEARRKIRENEKAHGSVLRSMRIQKDPFEEE